MLRLLWSVLLTVALMAGVADDNAIAARLKQKMSRSKLKSDDLKYHVKDGVVEWSGAVSVAQRKGAATRMAKTAGAKRVVNRIVVKGNASHPAAKPLPRTVTVRIAKP